MAGIKKISVPQGGGSMIDGLILITAFIFLSNSSRKGSRSLYSILSADENYVFFYLYMAILVIGAFLIIDALFFAQFTLDQDFLTVRGIFPKRVKKISLPDVEMFTFHQPVKFPLFFTPKITFKLKNGKYQSVHCSNKKIHAGIRQLAKDYGFEEKHSYIELF